MIDIREYLSSTSADPKKILKVVISLSVLLLVFWLFMVSRMEINGGNSGSNPVAQNRADSLRTALQPNQPDSAVERQSDRSPGLFLNAFTTFVILIAILAGVWLWIRKSPMVGSRDRFPEIERQMLGQGAELKVIEMNDEVWVLGITSGSVNLLYRYSIEEWTQKGGEPPASGQKDRFGDLGGSSGMAGRGGSTAGRSASDQGFQRFYDFFKGKT